MWINDALDTQNPVLIKTVSIIFLATVDSHIDNNNVTQSIQNQNESENHLFEAISKSLELNGKIKNYGATEDYFCCH